MKKTGITLILIGIIIAITLSVGLTGQKTETEYLRIHVRANSNDDKDQQVKYEVRDLIVEYLTPYIAECDTKSKAEKMLNGQAGELTARIEKYLALRGFNYGARVRIDNEYFPTRVYEDFTLDAGYYDAVIVELGTGEGNNWWCVVYPPLCFTKGENGIKYRSKILDIINSYKDRKEGK